MHRFINLHIAHWLSNKGRMMLPHNLIAWTLTDSEVGDFKENLKQFVIAMIEMQIVPKNLITRSNVYFSIKGGILPRLINCLFTQLFNHTRP